jgi:serine/threonine protein phosphatase 1
VSTFAIGDIHGNSAALDDVLDQLSREIGEGDTVVFLGDYIDRGPDTRGCLDRILSFQSGSSARVVTLMGNHEEWLLRTVRDHTRHSWLLGMEALPTIASYSPEAAMEIWHSAELAGATLVTERVELPYGVFLEVLPAAHLAFLGELEAYYCDTDAVYSHGGVDPRIPAIEDQPLEALLWGAGGFPDAYDGDRLAVYGHRNNAGLTDDGWPWPSVKTRTIGIDTISHGVLTAFMCPQGRVIQSRRHVVR